MTNQAVDTILQEAMREWLIECFTEEYDQEQIQELTYSQLTQAINRYYDGGMTSFISTVLE